MIPLPVILVVLIMMRPLKGFARVEGTLVVFVVVVDEIPVEITVWALAMSVMRKPIPAVGPGSSSPVSSALPAPFPKNRYRQEVN